MIDFCIAIIEKENLVVGLALLAHDGSTYLAEAYTMSPTLAMQDETVALTLYVESGGQQVSLAEGTADLEFLADGEGLFRADNLQFPDTSAFASLERDKILYLSKIFLQLAADKFRELCLGVFYSPAIEVGRLLIEVVEHLFEDGLIASVTVGVSKRYEIGLGRVFPTVLEFLCLTATALGETGIADLILIGKYLSAGLANGFCHLLVVGFCDALITLAMVIGTDIKDGVILAIVPADKLIILLRKREEAVATLFVPATFLDLSQQP